MSTLTYKRKSITLETKLMIIIDATNGTNNSVLSRTYGIPRSTIIGILKDQDKLMEAGKAGCEVKRTRLKAGKYPEMKESLLKWLKQQRSKNIPVFGDLIKVFLGELAFKIINSFFKEKAQEFAKMLGVPDFQASEGWLWNFKRREKLFQKGWFRDRRRRDILFLIKVLFFKQ